jgi:hypothetical protein
MTKEPLFVYNKEPHMQNPTLASGVVKQTGEEFLFTYKAGVARLFIYESGTIEYASACDPWRTHHLWNSSLPLYSADLGLGSYDGRAGRTLVDGLLTQWLLDHAKKPSIRLLDESGSIFAPIGAGASKKDGKLKFHIGFKMREYNVHPCARLRLNIDAWSCYLLESITSSRSVKNESITSYPESITGYPAAVDDKARREITTFDLGFHQGAEVAEGVDLNFELNTPTDTEGTQDLTPSAVLRYFRDNPFKVSVSWVQEDKDFTSNTLTYRPAWISSQLQDELA